GACRSGFPLRGARGAVRAGAQATRADLDAPRGARPGELSADERRQGSVLQRTLGTVAQRRRGTLPATRARGGYGGADRRLAASLSRLSPAATGAIVSDLPGPVTDDNR